MPVSGSGSQDPNHPRNFAAVIAAAGKLPANFNHWATLSYIGSPSTAQRIPWDQSTAQSARLETTLEAVRSILDLVQRTKNAGSQPQSSAWPDITKPEYQNVDPHLMLFRYLREIRTEISLKETNGQTLPGFQDEADPPGAPYEGKEAQSETWYHCVIKYVARIVDEAGIRPGPKVSVSYPSPSLVKLQQILPLLDQLGGVADKKYPAPRTRRPKTGAGRRPKRSGKRR